ncbi:MAG TPA: hypothetical protein VLH80_03665 [Nitrospiraceae bacterium]|jgi:hypothetical protein|nr:hypothetical protein [Nitrospiraceae bacterium]
MKSFTPFLLAGALLFAMPVFAQDAASSSANTNTEILIQKIKADKKLLVASNMELTDAEGKKFWPLYDAYQKELGKLNLRLGKVIQEYADAYNKGSVPNDTAKKLLKESLAIDEAELKLRKTSADKIGKVLSATKTARYIQIENKIRTVLRMELAENIPLVY